MNFIPLEIKPIFTMGIPERFPEMVVEAIKAEVPDEWDNSYHLVFYPVTGTEFVFNAFYPQDFNAIEFEAFKETLMANVKKIAE